MEQHISFLLLAEIMGQVGSPIGDLSVTISLGPYKFNTSVSDLCKLSMFTDIPLFKISVSEI